VANVVSIGSPVSTTAAYNLKVITSALVLGRLALRRTNKLRDSNCNHLELKYHLDSNNNNQVEVERVSIPQTPTRETLQWNILPSCLHSPPDEQVNYPTDLLDLSRDRIRRMMLPLVIPVE
jgi:hypothetical protein